MANQSSNNVRITARIPTEVKETLQKAADLSGATLNQFLLQAALKEAHQVLESQRIINLSERDAEMVFNLIENPPAPNTKLIVAASQHRIFFGETR